MGGGRDRRDEYKLNAAEGETVRDDDRGNEGMCLQSGVGEGTPHRPTRRKLPLNFVLSRDNNSTWLGHVD